MASASRRCADFRKTFPCLLLFGFAALTLSGVTGCEMKRPPRPKLHVLDFIVLDSRTKQPVKFTLNTVAVPMNLPLFVELSESGGTNRLTWLGPPALPVTVEAPGYAPATLDGGFVKTIDRFTTGPRSDSSRLILLKPES